MSISIIPNEPKMTMPTIKRIMIVLLIGTFGTNKVISKKNKLKIPISKKKIPKIHANILAGFAIFDSFLK